MFKKLLYLFLLISVLLILKKAVEGYTLRVKKSNFFVFF
jgi:hypothetical protein